MDIAGRIFLFLVGLSLLFMTFSRLIRRILADAIENVYHIGAIADNSPEDRCLAIVMLATAIALMSASFNVERPLRPIWIVSGALLLAGPGACTAYHTPEVLGMSHDAHELGYLFWLFWSGGLVLTFAGALALGRGFRRIAPPLFRQDQKLPSCNP